MRPCSRTNRETAASVGLCKFLEIKQEQSIRSFEGIVLFAGSAGFPGLSEPGSGAGLRLWLGLGRVKAFNFDKLGYFATSRKIN